VIGVFPLEAGSDQETVKPPSAGIAVTFSGAEGVEKVTAAFADIGTTATAIENDKATKMELSLYIFFMVHRLFKGD
jgi:hypothetical protein